MICVIDDEKRYIQSFVDELELCFGSDHEIKVIDGVDEAVKILADLEREARRPDVVILDIMMPPQSSFSPDETNGGFRTGLALFDRIRKSGCKVVVFTNVNDPSVRKFFEELDCVFIRKPDVLPHEFAARIRELLMS